MPEYPILDNRPIDQWKVTELKEELRRRKLITKGLKEDLVKRLDEAIRNEQELLKEKELESSVDHELEVQDKHEGKDPNPTGISQTEEVAKVVVTDDEREISENEVTMVDNEVNVQDAGQTTEVQHEPVGTVVQEGAIEDTVAAGATTEEDVSHVEVVVCKSDTNGEDFRDNVENKDAKLPADDTTSNLFEPENQVSEISPDSGFEVKCESISTDSVSINEKIELKDNLNANNFHLELDVVKPEMVQPSSSDVAPVAGDFNPSDNDQEPEDNQGSVEEIEDVANATSVDLSKEIGTSNGGSPEKLNLDRSSGDESMDEDVLDTKQIGSNINSDEVGDTREVRELHVVKEGTPVDGAVGGSLPNEDIVKEEARPVMPAEKRKLEDQGSLGTTEPVKRQRHWNAKTIKVPEPQNDKQTSSSTPKDIFQSTPRRLFTRTDSGLSVESPKERFVPPSQKTATNSLRVDRFLRPFTLKAVQELLGKTGTVCSFWMDHIKTHCYVTYSSVEEAIATRNALYNLQWPPNGGHLLMADFVDPQDVKMHVEAPESPAPVAPSTAAPPAPALERSNSSQHLQSNRQPLPPPPHLPQPPLVLQPPPVREHENLLPPPQPKKPEPPILTLDDLFKKTRATPRIYYLPLSEEQVAAKLAAPGRSNRV